MQRVNWKLGRTLRFRFAVWVAGWLLVTLAVFGAFVYWRVARGLTQTVDDSLRLSASQALAAISIENGQLDLEDLMPEGADAAALNQRDLTLRVLDPQGTLIKGVGEYAMLTVTVASLAAVENGQTLFEVVTPPGESDGLRFYTQPILENGRRLGILQVAQSQEDIQRTLRRLLQALLLGGPLAVVIAGMGGYLLAARALAPIDSITRTAQRIAANTGDLSARLNLPATADEVGQLAETFDQMLERLDDSFRRERQFTADASHELRTPLAAMQAILQVIRQSQRSPEDYEQALTDLSDETDRLRTLTEDLLRLARGTGPLTPTYSPVDLSMLLADVADSLRPLAEAKELRLTIDVPDNLMLMGDNDELIRLFVNLLDNAIQYTERGGITLAALKTTDQIVITITDTGIGISSEHLPQLFDRFYRVDKARTSQGAGLGLSIALAIAQAHGGTIEVKSIVNRGSNFMVRLPGLPNRLSEIG